MRIRDKQTGQVYEGPDGTPYDTAKYEIVSSSPGEGASKPVPGFLDLLKQSPEVGLGQDVNPVTSAAVPGSWADVVRTASAAPPGLLGAGTSMLGSVAADLMEGQSPDFWKAGRTGATVGLVGQLARLINPASKLRISGTGRGKDAEIAAGAVRGANTALQPGGSAASLMDTMRGTAGQQAMKDRLGAARAELAERLPTQSPKGMPLEDTSPLSREQFIESTGKLTELGDRGFNLRGAARDSPSAIRARRQYGAQRKELTEKLDQTSPANRQAFDQQQRDWSAATELRRQFRPNTGEGPDRVFRPGGFSLQDLQERGGKRIEELQGRLGKEAADEYLRKIHRGGKPGEGTDRPLAISGSKFGGFRIPTGLELLAGPGADPRPLQALLQILMPGLTEALNR